MPKSDENIYWFNDDHRAWSANDLVRNEVQAYQKRNDNISIALSVTGLVVAIICTAISGDAGNFFGFLIIVAGAIMLIGQVRGT